MENNETNKLITTDIDEKILKTFDLIEEEKEEKLVILIIEIIVSSTLKEFYEKGN